MTRSSAPATDSSGPRAAAARPIAPSAASATAWPREFDASASIPKQPHASVRPPRRDRTRTIAAVASQRPLSAKPMRASQAHGATRATAQPNSSAAIDPAKAAGSRRPTRLSSCRRSVCRSGSFAVPDAMKMAAKQPQATDDQLDKTRPRYIDGQQGHADHHQTNPFETGDLAA